MVHTNSAPRDIGDDAKEQAWAAPSKNSSSVLHSFIWSGTGRLQPNVMYRPLEKRKDSEKFSNKVFREEMYSVKKI